MNRRTGATAPMSPADVRARARKAHGFLDAIALLESLPTDVAPAVAQLRALVDLKSRAHYEPRLITAADASGALTSAERLLVAMDTALA